MALRGVATGYSTADAATVTVTVSGIGIQAGDIVLLFGNGIGDGGSETFSITGGTGFAAVSGVGTQKASGGNILAQCWYKIAGASEPTTYVMTTTANDRMLLHCRVYSGRSGSFTATAVTNTDLNTSVPTTITFSNTGVTAAAGDDICVFQGMSGGGSGSTYTYTPSSGFGNGAKLFSGSGTQAFSLASDKVNASAGATGTIAGTLADNQGASYAWVGLVISMAAAPVGLSVPQTASNTSAANPVSATLSGAQSAGAIIVLIHCNGDPGVITITDTVNTGTYALMGPKYYVSGIGSCAAYWVKTNGTGTPIIQASNGNAAGMSMIVFNVAGFSGNPTADPNVSANINTTATSSTAVAGTPQSNFNNEILVSVIHDGSFVSVQPSGWTGVAGQGWYSIQATGASVPFAATLGSSTGWIYLSAGLYDNTTVTPSPIRKVRRQIFTTYYPA